MTILRPTPVCERLGVRYPIFGFSHSPEVVVEIARAGGFGVLGLAREMPEDVSDSLVSVERQLDGLPYGVDLMLPQNVPEQGDVQSLRDSLPAGHVKFVEELKSALTSLSQVSRASLRRRYAARRCSLAKQTLS